MQQDRPIVVAGDIGGLAVAPGPAQNGFRIMTPERASSLSEVGAGIQPSLHAFHAPGAGDAAHGTGLEHHPIKRGHPMDEDARKTETMAYSVRLSARNAL